MREISATMTSKGQVTVPREVRALLRLESGDKLTFAIAEDGSICLRRPRFPTVDSLVGAAGSLDRPLSWDEMRTIAREDRFAARSDGQR